MNELIVTLAQGGGSKPARKPARKPGRKRAKKAATENKTPNKITAKRRAEGGESSTTQTEPTGE
jgi:hypothetical protein